MYYIDSHVHIGNYMQVKKCLKTSEFKNVYRLYSCLNSEALKSQERYISQCKYVFGIPIVLKEISISEANRYLLEFSSHKSNIIPVYFVGTDVSFYESQNSKILKEHFIHHDWEKLQERTSSYEYLSQKNGYLLLHSLASIRVEYVHFLRMNFPKMNIIIAHMGRDGKKHFSYMANILNEFKNDEKVFFDSSTINDAKQLLYAIKVICSSRILFASDFPYECNGEETPFNFYGIFYRLGLPSSDLENLFYKNALRIIK